jgi:hypothetical protein
MVFKTQVTQKEIFNSTCKKGINILVIAKLAGHHDVKASMR